MLVYAGGVGGEQALTKLREYEMGRLVSPRGWKRPQADIPWCVDNDAYGDYKRGVPWAEELFADLFYDGENAGVGKLYQQSYAVREADFIAIPDRPFGGKKSLSFSRGWFDRLAHDQRWYLVVQPGMSEADVARAWEDAYEDSGVALRGIFIGGDQRYKWRAIRGWRAFTRDRDAGLHVGGLSTVKALARAMLARADSADSSAFGRFNKFSNVPEARRLAQGQRVLSLV